ncbi:CapA family protein [Cyclobacterium jeungdonense]
MTARLSIANLVNNHILDFDKEGFLDTITALEKAVLNTSELLKQYK